MADDSRAEDFRTPEMYRRELSRMEAAMTAHIDWLKNWHLKVFAEPDEDADDDRAIEPSPFKTWYYGLPSDLFEDSPVFAALGFSLESMQGQAESLAERMQNGEAFPAEDYVAFMDSARSFADMVFRLMREAMSQIAFVDDLTGVGNEQGMRTQIVAELERVRRTDQRACVALLEIADHHIVGAASAEDDVFHVNRAEIMSQFAQSLAGLLRPYDQLFCTHDDDFMIVLPYTETDIAEHVVNRLYGALTGGKLVLMDGTKVDLTLNVGIASIEPGDEVESVVDHAEIALSIARDDKETNIHVYRP